MKRCLFAIAFLIMALSCETENIKDSDSDMILSDEEFINLESDAFSITSALIDGDSLRVKLRFGGGCGEVSAKLYGASSVMESFPVQRNIKIIFSDEDWCKALVLRSFAFDLSPLRVQGNSQVIFHLEDWETSLNYLY